MLCGRAMPPRQPPPGPAPASRSGMTPDPLPAVLPPGNISGGGRAGWLQARTREAGGPVGWEGGPAEEAPEAAPLAGVPGLPAPPAPLLCRSCRTSWGGCGGSEERRPRCCQQAGPFPSAFLFFPGALPGPFVLCSVHNRHFLRECGRPVLGEVRGSRGAGPRARRGYYLLHQRARVGSPSPCLGSLLAGVLVGPGGLCR